jgi:SRSO17 transposase
MIEHAVQAGVPRGVVLADCDYGNKTVFRDTLSNLGVKYAVDIQSTTRSAVSAREVRLANAWGSAISDGA